MASFVARKPHDIADVVRAVRKDAELTQAELADKLAFSRHYMVDLESRQPTLFRVLHELGITVTLTCPDSPPSQAVHLSRQRTPGETRTSPPRRQSSAVAPDRLPGALAE